MNNQMQLFAEGGLKDEGGEIDEVSGNEVPIGGTKEGVRDDIPANVSEGEFVMPADVVRYHGLDKMMQIRQEAKMGLKKMEAMGQMGNSDEATIDDDMPFSMTDLMVVSADDEPMEFADGGFIPVKDYTEVQNMISDKAQKGAGYAEGGLTTETLSGELLRSSPRRDEDGNIITTGATEELTTVDVPVTDPTEEIDYDAYMGSVTTVTKEYRNAAGDSVVITFINGVATTPIPEGYTLYDPSVAPTGVGGVGVSGASTKVVNTFNNNNDNDNNNQTTVQAEPINYAGMSDEEFATRMEYENTAGYVFGTMVGVAIASLVPFGGSLMYTALRSHARKSEQRLNDLIKKAKTPEEIARYTSILKSVLKNARLKSAEESGAFAKWVDGYLVGNGYTPEEAKAAAEFVRQASSVSQSVDPNTTITTPQEEADVVTQINNIAKQFGMTEEQAATVLVESNNFNKSLGDDSGGGAASTNVYATMMNKLNLSDEQKEVARKKLVGKGSTSYTSNIKNTDTRDILREQASGLAPAQSLYDPQAKQKGMGNEPVGNLIQAPVQKTRDMSGDMKINFGDAVGGAAPVNMVRPTLPVATPAAQMDTAFPTSTSPYADAFGDYTGSRGLTKAADNIREEQASNANFSLNQPVSATVADSSRMLKNNQPLGQQVLGENYTPTSAQLNKQLAASGQTNLTTVGSDPRNLGGSEGYAPNAATAGTAPTLVQGATLGSTTGKETFNQAFSRNKLAGAKVFTHTDGKQYTTETVEERKAQQAIPAGKNSPFQDAANALTKNDGRSYVNGVLLDDVTKQPYVKPPSDIDDNYGGDIYGPLNDPNRGKTYEDASSGGNVVNRTGAPIAKANQAGLAKRLGDPGEGMVWGVQPGTNTLSKIGITRIGIKKDGTRVEGSDGSSSGNNNNDTSSSSTRTYSSLAAAARDGQHGNAVNITGRGLQRVAFGNKTYDAKMKKASENSRNSGTAGSNSSGSSGSNRSDNAVNTAASGRTVAQIQADINQEVSGGWTARANDLVKERDSANNNDGGGTSSSSSGDGGGGCCFIMLEARYGNGTMDKVVRRYRDEYMTQRNRRGYYKLAEVLVPLMRKSKAFKWVVTKTFADPLVAYGKYYYGQNKYGVLYSPIKSFWMKVFDVLGGETEFIRENGEVV